MKPIFIFLIIAVILLGGWFFFSKKNSKTVTLSPSPSPTPTPTNRGSAPIPNVSDLPDKILATMQTSKGNIELELYPKAAPKTVLNFMSLAQKSFYDGTKFHRVVPGFVIQGGDPLSKTDDPKTGTGGPGYLFEDEINPRSIGVSDDLVKQLEAAGYAYNYNLKSLPNTVGALAMANAGPNTNGSQFFIITEQDQPSLNGKHTVFGRVVGGMEVVKAIVQGDVVKKIEIKL